MSKNTTKVRKGVSRKIQTQQFESLEIVTAYEDVIHWETMEERDDKLDKLSQLALIDFNKTFDTVCDDLGVKPKSGSVTMKTEDGSIKRATIETANDKKDSKEMSADTMEDFFDGI